MSTLDDMAHAAEVEAEVLRAIGHLSPAAAQEFLVALALKIRRCQPAPARGVTLPKLLASTITAKVEKPAPPTPTEDRRVDPTIGVRRSEKSRVFKLVELVKARGKIRVVDAKRTLAETAIDRDRLSASISYCLDRGVLRRDHENGEDWLSFVTMPDVEAPPPA